MGRIIDLNLRQSIGPARALLALNLILVLALNDVYDYFPLEYYEVGKKQAILGLQKFNLFYVFGYESLNIAKYLAISVMVLVLLGVAPIITCFLHTWIAYSFISSSILVEGGDQMNAILSLLLMPICIGYGIKNSWGSSPTSEGLAGLIRTISYDSIKIQMAACYLVASLAKLTVTEWSNGTALYYWLNSNVFGASGFLLRLLSPVFSSPFLLYVLTISIMLIEFLLFLGLFSRNRSFNNKLFVLGLGFHLGIWFLVGLGPFSMVMVAGLYLFLIFKHDSIISNFFQHEAHLSTTK